MTSLAARGPYFDELVRGQVFADAPAVTLTEGAAAVHQSIVGDRLRIALDRGLATAVTGQSSIAHPAYVWNVAIGQSTVATHHVRANLFYRGLAFHRAPELGDTLFTTTTVVGLKQNSRRPGRPSTGLAALHIQTIDQRQRTVLDFYRCAMLPLLDPEADTGHADELDDLGAERPASSFADDWDLTRFRCAGSQTMPRPGTEITVVGGDVVSSAPELARLTLNVAQVHHDAAAAGGQRLVYGGHTIALALSQVSRALPHLITVLAWDGCDHLGPVHEGDTLRSQVHVLARRDHPSGGSEVDLRCLVSADSADGPRAVLDWRFSALAR